MSLSVSFGQEKQIRLRNEIIHTSPSHTGTLHAESSDSPTNGLFLVQFEGVLQPAWREVLASNGVTLLRSVPDDAAIVRLKGTRLQSVRQLGFVRYVGPYKVEHKVHRQLQDVVKGSDLRVGILLAPDAGGIEFRSVSRHFQRIIRQSKSRFGNVIQGIVRPADLASLAQSPAVLWIEPGSTPKLLDEISAEITEGERDGPGTDVQFLGFDGRGVTVSVADSGLDNGDAATMHPDLAGRVDQFFFYGSLLDAADEHSHGTHVSGIVAGNGATGETDENGYLYGLGMAPRAHLVAQRIFDGVGGFEAPPSNEVLTHDAVRAGAVIGSNSWGDDTQGRYDLSAMEFDALVRDADKDTPGDQPYILEFSAGNAGPGQQTIGSPAVAKNVIATGASQNNRLDFFIYAEGQEAMADFSSRGPCEDGRIKPDVVAPGTWIASLQSASASDDNSWMGISPFYQYQGGTSQAGPHVSGAAAVFVQYYRETHQGKTPSPALVKAALINSAVDMDDDFGTDPVPNNDEGWGRIDLSEMIGADRKFDFTDQTDLLSTGRTFEKRFIVADPNVPLKVTLVYTDVPGLPAAIPALVNDLDLEVVGPDGTVYRGNQFLDGESTGNAAGSDHLNNVEAVHIAEPLVGEYILRVIGRNVVEDARRDTVAIDQDFALVVSGPLPAQGQGVIGLDRRAYTAPGVVQIKLIDFDLAGKPNVDVTASSTTEITPMTVKLLPFGAAGVFTGSVTLATGPAVADNKLQVNHGDLIKVQYHDLSPAGDVLAQADVDLLPPVISDVASTNQFGKQIVSWQTDEQATTIVRYGTNRILTFALTNNAFVLDHALGLAGLKEGSTYQFSVVSVDEAGNAATNDNKGQLFSFIAKPASTVLLVDAYIHDPNDDSMEIPVSSYTDALDATGVSYDVWNITKNGSPALADLTPFRVVMWRINDSIYESTSTLTVPQQTVISNYVNNGGSFFMSSMEILSRVGNVSFRTNILHMGEFITNPDPTSNCATCDEDHGVPVVQGRDRDPISNGVDVTLDYSQYPVIELEPIAPNIGPDVSDTFVPTTNAAAIFIDGDSGKKVGASYPLTGQDSPGRVVFLSFPLDAIPLTGDAPNNRAVILRNILDFLAPGLNGFGTIALDSATFTIPSQVTVEVADSDMAGRTDVTVQFFSTSQTNGQTIRLTETVRPGLFRGTITLVATNQPIAAGRLRVKAGDSISAEYFDQSTRATVRAVADIDTSVPTISDISVDPLYEVATITWETSEQTDALVQFGESTFLGRTAYRAAFETDHEVTLLGLQPNRLYYYQVVSRDPAGNTAVDDNKGKLYTFQTLKPISPPWFDDLERTNTNWTVYSADESETGWELGPPANGLESRAHSGTNVWGSNLYGSINEVVETFLISPAIDLSGGNTASVRFWHSYDFTADAITELGQLMIITNNDSAPVTLVQYDDTSGGWEEQDVDLSAYLGHVVQLIWHYELLDFSADGHQHPGWLLDDISVSVTNIIRGTIRVTNNLAQGAFTITGSSEFAGQGWDFSTTNAIAGTYVINFGAVPYYVTPAPQTNILTAGAPILFRGVYTFPDTNGNGISDLWEQQFFGTVSAARTRLTDSDSDGAPDLAEFIAGTDPKDKSSVLRAAVPVPLPGGRLRLDWASVPGRYYRVLGSVNGVTWTSFSGWLRSVGLQNSYIVPPLDSKLSYLFRVEVAP